MLHLKIINDGTGTNEIGNYTYSVWINKTCIETGSIKAHQRRKGWRTLVSKLVWDSYHNEEIDLIKREAWKS